MTQNSKNLDEDYLPQLKNVKFRPIFILGLPRSGTSILYKTLTKTKKFNAVTSYHILMYKHLLYNHRYHLENQAKQQINQYLTEKGLKDRGIDTLQVSADFSEEYGYILQQHTRHLFIHPSNTKLFIELAKKIQYISENNKPLLLKNPFDFQNTLYIKKIFPDAKFIFISRDPIKIFSSTIKAIRILLMEKNHYSIEIFRAYKKIMQNPFLRYSARLVFSQLSIFGLLYITRVYTKVTKRFMKNISRHSPNDYIIVKYEDFCIRPQNTIMDIMKFLNLELEETHDLTTMIKSRNMQIEPIVHTMHSLIYKRLKNYYDFFGYVKPVMSDLHRFQ